MPDDEVDISPISTFIVESDMKFLRHAFHSEIVYKFTVSYSNLRAKEDNLSAKHARNEPIVFRGFYEGCSLDLY